jgi:hypothetical protein
MNEQLKNRLKSFGWRLGMAVIAFAIDWILKNIALLDMGTAPTVVLALVLGEISKYLNTK